MTKKKTSTGKTADLRKQAEKIARKKEAKSPEKLKAMSPEETRQSLHELRVHQIELEMQNEELRRSQVELDAAGESFFDFYDLAPVGYVTISEKGLILEANLTAATMLGVVRSELVLQPLTRFILPADQDIYYEQSKQFFEAVVPQAYELRMMKKDGSTFWARLLTVVRQDADSAPSCRMVISNVNESKQKEDALRIAHWRLEGIIEGTHLGTWEWNVQTGETIFNDVWAKVIGFTLAELAPISIKTWETLCHPDDLKQSAELLERHFAGELPYYDVECRMKHKDGYWVWVHDRGRVMNRTAEGKPLIMFGTHSDITLRKRFEEVQTFLAQTSSGAQGETFFEILARYLAQNLSMDYVCIDRLEGDELNARTVAVWCDGHFEDNVTYALKDTPCGDVVGKTVCFFPASVCQLFPRDPALQELRAESYIGVTLFDHTGRPIGLIAVIGRRVLSLEKRQMIEATLKIVAVRAAGEMERLDAVEALRENETRLNKAQQIAHVGSWELDILTNHLIWSDEIYRIFGLQPQEFGATYEAFLDAIHPDDRAAVDAAYSSSMREGLDRYEIEHRVVRKHTNDVRYVHERCEHVRDASGRIVRSVGMVHDITARKQMEEELLRAQKLESLGVLAGGIAHDFNNLLGVVQGYIDLVINDLPPGHVSRQLLLTAMRSVSQTKDLTSRLITFSRGGGPIKEIFDVDAIIREAVQRTVKGTKVRVNFDFRDELWPAEVDDLQMKQVFNNLTKNAVEATPAGGILTIQAENALLSAGGALDLQAGAYLKITFTDEGIGIHEDHLAKIFDPYFSTKRLAAQNGLGLGLAVCYSVLKSHDGHITVQSLPGQGSSFVLYIPARPELAREKEVKKTTSTDSRVGPVRVLIMDDDPQIRGLMRAYLERMDYEVTDVQEGQEAIDAYRKALESETPFDLTLLELKVRQGMGGEIALKRLLKIAPSIKAIIVSEYADDPVMLKYADYGFQGALKKPFKREEMKYLVEKVLNPKG